MKSNELRSMADIRKKNEFEKSERTDEIYKKIPEIEVIDREIKKIGAETSRKIMAGAEGIKEDADERIRDLIHKKKQLLKENDFPEDYLDLKYDCLKCKDKGYLPDGKRCECLSRMLIENNIEKSSLKALIYKQNFDTFDINLFSDSPYKKEKNSPMENMKLNLQVAINFTDWADKETDNLFFYGNAGTGKTFLSSAIAKGFLDRGKTVFYQTVQGVLGICEAYHFKKERTDEYENLFEVDLLIIDDLGSETTNAFTNSALFDLINSRMIYGKKIIISSNLNIENGEIQERYSERISSRLMQFIKLRFFGDDLRKQI